MKNKDCQILSLLLLILALPFFAFTQTNVGGTYFSNQHWLASGSPYTVTSDFQVAPGFTLTVDSGVHVNFTGNTEILLKGGIQALGTATHPIVFNGAGAKNVLHFMDADLSYSHLAFCELSGGGTNTILMDGACSDIATIENTTLTNCNIFQNRALGGTFHIYGSQLQNVQVESQVEGNGTALLQIESSSLSNCTLEGIPLSGAGIPLEVLSSQLQGCHFQTAGFSTIPIGLSFQSDTMQQCFFHSSYVRGIVNGCLIVDSEFSNNGFTQQNHLVYDISNTHIVNTDFVGGSILGNQWALNVDFMNCLIEKTGSTVMAFDYVGFTNTSVLGDGTGTGVRTTYINASNSLFKWHNVGIHFGHTYQPTSLSIDHCNIWGNNQYNAICDTTYGADATGTWWGTSDSLTIFTKILDYYDNLLHGEIVLGNWPSTPDTNAPMSPPGGLSDLPGSGFHTISWDPNPESDLAGYGIYFWTTDGYRYARYMSVGNVTSYQLPDSIYNQGFAVVANDGQANGFQDILEGHQSGFARLAGHTTPAAEFISDEGLELRVFPNPTDVELTIAWDLPGETSIFLYDLSGRKVLQEVTHLQELQLNVDGIAPGMYLVRVQSGRHQTSRKVLVR